MKIVADLHIHSKYSRATSPLMEVESMAPWAKKKGINVLGTGDFTHPEYFKLLKSKLKQGANGLYTLKKGGPETAGVNYMLTSEVSNIFTQGGKGRRVHILIFAPSLEVVEKINKAFAARGNVVSDGRPIFGFSAKDLVKIVLDISPECLIVPAHAWTPWFAVFGSKSGFDSLEECFEEETKNIYAIETGLSSDITMNRRLSDLDNITLISNSDAHSVSRLGREANVLDCELSYEGIVGTFRKNNSTNFLYTIEYFPDEGRYHYDGHRVCRVCLHPRESNERKNRCPVCFKPLTLGVMHRVEDLADRAWDYNPEGFTPQKHAVQLVEILSEALETGPASKKVGEYYDKIMSKGVSELDLLLESTPDELSRLVLPRVKEGILLVREGKVSIAPGYDGEYGKVMLFGKKEETLGMKNRARRMAQQPELF